MHRLLNLILRGLTILFKSVLVFYIAKMLSPQDMATYGILTISISYFVYVVGLDFYTYYTRELVKSSPDSWGKEFKNTLAVFAVMYCICLPIIVFLFNMGVIEKVYLVPFVILLVLEHFVQEFVRIMVIKGSVLTSSFVNFIRYAAWCPIVIALMLYEVIESNLINILYAWIFGGLLGLIFGFYIVYTYNVSGWAEKVNLSWVKKGILISLPLLIGTLCMRGVFTFDRYWLKVYYDVSYLAAYSFFGSFTTVVPTIVDSLVFTYSYPKLISLFHNKEMKEYRAEIVKMTIAACILTVLSSIILYIATILFIRVMGLDFYQERKGILVLMFVAAVFSCISMVPHYILYSQGKDKFIYWNHIILFFVFMVSLVVLSPLYDGYIVPVCVLIFYVFMLFLKSYFSYMKCEFK